MKRASSAPPSWPPEAASRLPRRVPAPPQREPGTHKDSTSTRGEDRNTSTMTTETGSATSTLQGRATTSPGERGSISVHGSGNARARVRSPPDRQGHPTLTGVVVITRYRRRVPATLTGGGEEPEGPERSDAPALPHVHCQPPALPCRQGRDPGTTRGRPLPRGGRPLAMPTPPRHLMPSWASARPALAWTPPSAGRPSPAMSHN